VSGWDFTDAWVFAAVAGSGPRDGASLAEIVLNADALNHALLLESEFTTAFGRLRAAGLADGSVPEDRYWLTGKGAALRAEYGFRGLSGWLDVVPRALASLDLPMGEPWALPAGAFDEAVRAYLS
jgi:hypothetical protein